MNHQPELHSLSAHQSESPKIDRFNRKKSECDIQIAAKEEIFPSYLDEVNFLSLDGLEGNVEDTITINTYHRAITENKHLFYDKIALHLTDGINCLYSMFLIEAGCKKVYCVVNGHSENQIKNMLMMKAILEENKCEKKVEVLSFKDFNAEVDIIIAQPMGYCLHFDGILDRVIEARDLYLSKNGIVLPNYLSFKCALIHDEHFYDHKVQYWNEVYGVKMKSMRQWISHEPIIRVVDPSMVVSDVIKLYAFNLEKVTYQDIIELKKNVEFTILGDNLSNGITFWFQSQFSHGMESFDIKASPWFESTRFTQCSLYQSQLVKYKPKQKVALKFNGKKFPKEGYSIIHLEIDGNKYQYSFS